MSPSSAAVLRNRILPLAALAVAISFAAGCGERNQTADAAAPADTHHAAPVTDVAAAPESQDIHDSHDAHTAGELVLPPVPATPWQSDAPLREGMRRMHRAVDALGHGEHDHLDAAQITAAAGEVQAAADYMFANCKLDAEPDVALHGLLAVLIKGANDLKANPGDMSPLAGMREVIALYPRMFVDPQWQADTAPPPA